MISEVPNVLGGKTLTWKSPRLDAVVYRKLTVANWIAEYKLIYLKQQKLVTSELRPSL
jgi:hypothetical protein